MTQPYRLHYAPDNASLIVRLALLELVQPFEAVLVDRSVKAQKSPAYLALNPAGRIPALETPDGALFETAAILLWLADRHGSLFPSISDPSRGDALKWLFYVSNTLHANLLRRFYPDHYIDGERDALRDGAVRNIKESFDLLEAVARERPAWLNGAEPSILDFYIAATLRWSQIYPAANYGDIKADMWPALHNLMQRLETRTSVANLIEAEGLGATPFSNPAPYYHYKEETA